MKLFLFWDRQVRSCDVYKWRAVECKTILEKFFFYIPFQNATQKASGS